MYENLDCDTCYKLLHMTVVRAIILAPEVLHNAKQMTSSFSSNTYGKYRALKFAAISRVYTILRFDMLGIYIFFTAKKMGN